MQNALTVAWCGDSRAVICQGNSNKVRQLSLLTPHSFPFEGTKAIRLTRDHKPKLPDEEKRIKDLGGIVDVSDEGVYRVMGVLAVSRALGDIDLKEPVPYVSPVPELKSMVLTPRDQFIIAGANWICSTDSHLTRSKLQRLTECGTCLATKAPWTWCGVTALLKKLLMQSLVT